jgi:hypothetical protein
MFFFLIPVRVIFLSLEIDRFLIFIIIKNKVLQTLFSSSSSSSNNSFSFHLVKKKSIKYMLL